jgi:hypothetical protein
MSKATERDLHKKIKTVLLEKWDPIGVQAIPGLVDTRQTKISLNLLLQARRRGSCSRLGT